MRWLHTTHVPSPCTTSTTFPYTGFGLLWQHLSDSNASRRDYGIGQDNAGRSHQARSGTTPVDTTGAPSASWCPYHNDTRNRSTWRFPGAPLT